MKPLNLILVLLTTVVGFCILYAPQPLLPVLAEDFQISPAEASLLITVTMIPLALAPLFYGYLLEGIAARTLLLTAIALLAVSQWLFQLADSYWQLILIRSFQGLLLPALYTSLMTYCSSMAADGQVKRIMSFYITATIFGGFAGRAVSGWLSGFDGWRPVFLFWALTLALIWLLLLALDSDAETRFGKVSPKVFHDIVAQDDYRRAYLLIFAVFFCFAAVLNFLPFQLRELDPEISLATIGLAYGGYLMGMVTALYARRISRFVGNETRAIQIGLLTYLIGTALFALPWVEGMYGAMVVFCAGMFLVHSLLSGHVNHHARQYKGIVNGLYIAAYYTGGALGSWLPGYLYRLWGWESLLGLLTVMLMIALYGAGGFVTEESQA